MRNSLIWVLSGCLAAVSLAGCTTASRFDPRSRGDELDAGKSDAGTGDDDDAGSADAAVHYGGLEANKAPADVSFDLFAESGHRFWFEVSDEQLARINGGEAGGFFGGGDIYEPAGDKTYVQPMLLQLAGGQDVIDYGKVQVRLVGALTRRNWDTTHIPNLRLDADEFVDKQRIGGYEHLRLNNSLVGTIFREHMAHEIYRALGYPALRSSYAWVGSNVWGNDAWVPMTLIEVYKRHFCTENQATLGSTCTNMWEFANDLTQPLPVDACQVSSCDNTTLSALIEALRGLPRGPGFAKKLDKIVDWKMFHQFQCISWMLATPDDPIHAGNNLVIAERDSDHKLVWLPYSVDISSQTDVPDQRVPLTGSTVLPRGCQSDPDCWKDTLATCDDLIGKLEQVNPRKMLSDTVAQLEALGMLRDGDQERAEQLDHWYEQQQASLRSELEYFSHIPDVTGACPENTVRCQDGACAKQATCDARSCPTDKPWCPARGACVSRKYDTCPTCPKAKPFYCGVTKACVVDDVTCNDECLTTAGPGFSYCALFGTCVQDGACFDDGGGGGPIID